MTQTQTQTQTQTSDMEAIVVRRDGVCNLRFVGRLIASVSSSSESSRSDYSGSVGRWTELYLYRTRGGKFVCASVGGTQWQGEHTRYSGGVCDSEAEVVEYFGTGWLAKDLYEQAGIDAAEDID